LIQYVPTNIAPNVLTFLGFLCTLFMFLLITWFCPQLGGYAPGWVYFGVAVFVFLYQTLDNLDGRQARRTMSSSALGEAFDHGADSFATMFFAMTLGTALNFGPLLTFITQTVLMAVFYGCHWEAYFTGILVLRPLDNPTEAQCAIMALMLICSILGPQFWETIIALPIVGEVGLNQIVFFIYVVGAVNSCYGYWSKISEHYEHLQMRKVGPMLCLAPLFTLIFLSTLCVYLTPVLLTESPRMFLSAVGLFFSYIQIRLILQNICKEPFKPFYNVTLGFMLFTFNCFLESVGVPLIEATFLVQVLFLYHLGLVSYVIFNAVTELSTILNIRVFFIAPRENNLLV